MMKRAALGLQLTSTGTVRDTIGVFVSRVTPKGPAENAGIIEGDRIVSINGTDLRVSAADAGDSYAGELPSRRLSRAVEKLSPGNLVTLRVSSGGRIHDVQVTAGRASDLREGPFGMMMGMGGMDGMLRSMPRMNMDDFRGMQMENFPRMRMEDFPRMRIESMPKMNPEEMKRMGEDMRRMKQDMPMLRERMQELPLRLREMEMAPMRMRLRDGGTYKTLAPRVHVMSPDGSVYIYRDSAGRKTWTYDSKTKAEKAAAEKAAVEKAKKDKDKKKN
ncbi:MAG: PDZ domain-containing protein [Gemmatimonadaceae bacterium]